MKSTPKIFARIAFVLRIIIWLQILLFLIFPIIFILTAGGTRFMFEEKLELDTAGYCKHSLKHAAVYKNIKVDDTYKETIPIYNLIFGANSKIKDSLVIIKKRLNSYQSGRLIYSKNVDSLNKANPNWLVELHLKVERERFAASIKNADSLIKIGEITHAQFDSTGGHLTEGKSKLLVSSPKKIVKFHGNMSFIPLGISDYSEELTKIDTEFGGQPSSKLALSNYAVLTKVNNSFEIEITGSKNGTFEQKLTYYTSYAKSILFLLLFFGSTVFFRKFFVRLSNGEIFSNRQGNVFAIIGYIFLFHFFNWILNTIYDNYLFSKLMALKKATTFRDITFEDFMIPASYLIVGLICLALAQVFKYGMKIEKDNERTI